MTAQHRPRSTVEEKTSAGKSVLHLPRSLVMIGAVLLLALLANDTCLADVLTSEPSESVLINEIHYKPEPVTDRVEFVELYNAGTAVVDLSGWLLDGGIDYLFPDGVTLNPDTYLVIAQHPDRFRAKYGWTPRGPFGGRLNNDGEHLILRDDNAATIDEVRYTFGFPWPTVSVYQEDSIQLISASVDNAYPGAWRSDRPTPGRLNATTVDNAPPFVDEVFHSPQLPASGDDVTISARIVDADGVASATMLYQIVEPGNYIAVHDSAYRTTWVHAPMTAVADDRWQAILPASVQQHRRLIRYRIYARDRAGHEQDVPYADDPQPNFAYFVYDGTPPWTASVNGGPVGQVSFDFNQMRPLPIYHFIAKRQDVADALFMPPSELPDGYRGDDYPWRGTFVHDGIVFDHVTFRARGGLMRYATGKNMWKINFHPGHRFQGYDDHGRPYPVKWDKLNLSAVIQQTHRGYRGEQGLFEAMSYRLFNLAGVEGPATHFAHLRVIDDDPQVGPSQYEGDYWGLYLAVEQMDGQFLDQHGLPDGNLYKMDIPGPEKNNQGGTSDNTFYDILAFLNVYQQGWPSDDWWRDSFDLDRYYSYRAILEAIHHYDVNEGKNYFYYLNPETKRWSVHPWDVDLTWAEEMAGTGEEPFLASVLSRESFQVEYQNRLREVRDLLFNPDQVFPMLDEYASFIDTPANGHSMVDADRFLWDYNPICDTRYVISNRTRPGHFYRAAETGDFRGMVELMKRWVTSRSAWIDSTLLTDGNHPDTPSVNYIGPAGYLADRLQFSASAFQDPQGAHTFSAMEWRAAEVTNIDGPLYDPAEPWHYEIDAVVESGELSGYVSTWTIPNGVIKPQRTYRVRLRMKDNSGRWSHWSPAVQFVAGEPAIAPPRTLAFTEIMFHPPHFGPRAGDDLEFIELTNTGTQPIDLSGATFSEGIEYRFTVGATLQPAERLVLASNVDAFDETYNVAAFDEYDRQLSNSGERLTLVDAYGRVLTSVEYDDDVPWPSAADGDGHSLVLVDEDGENGGAANWRQSTVERGSPGAVDPLPVLVNELLANPGLDGADRLELYNPSDRPADIAHWYLTDNLEQPRKYRIAANTTLQPGEYLVLSAGHLDRSLGLSNKPEFDAKGGEAYLFSADASGRLTGYRHGFSFGASDQDVSFGRVNTSDGMEHFVAQERLSFGVANPGPQVGPIVFSEINYHPAGGDEYIELTNISERTVRLYDPQQPQRTWRIDGVFYELPSGVEIGPGERLLVVPGLPSEVCLIQSTEVITAAIGPYPLPLSDDGQSITLLKPTAADEPPAYVVVDQVRYDDVSPWPAIADGHGAALQRVTLTGFGNEPQNWHERLLDATVQSADATLPYARLCSFDAHRNTKTGNVEIEWVSHTEQNVAAYRVWRSDGGTREHAQLVEEATLGAKGVDNRSAHYRLIDTAPDAEDRTLYWLEAVGEGDNAVDVAFTRLRRQYLQLFLPVIMGGK